jgi:hypothetical protein
MASTSTGALDRRQLLGSAAGLVAAGIAPPIDAAKATDSAAVNVAARSTAVENPLLNVCPATAARIAQIAARNQIRAEAGLPLLSVTRELRRMKEASDTAEFEAFAEVHRKAVWDDIRI